MRNGFDSFARAIATLHSSTNATQLTITSINDFASTWLVPRLPKFQNAHPDIDLHLQTSVTVCQVQTESEQGLRT